MFRNSSKFPISFWIFPNSLISKRIYAQDSVVSIYLLSPLEPYCSSNVSLCKYLADKLLKSIYVQPRNSRSRCYVLTKLLTNKARFTRTVIALVKHTSFNCHKMADTPNTARLREQKSRVRVKTEKYSVRILCFSAFMNTMYMLSKYNTLSL